MTAWLTALLVLGLSPVEAKAYAFLAGEGRAHEWACLDEIVAAESSWDPAAIGDREIGGSYGLVQRHAPAHGMPPWPWPVADQIRWTIEYADDRYGGICEGLEFRRERGWW